mmetsp:Transcript_16885/g.24602  ORF Transcript_16885/g.24602 Transcript_16885/m.24602 type:complete len:120 (-) Transcript_16885:247-606(-)
MKKIYTFEEARRIARKHGFHSSTEFLEYECPGAYGLPKNVEDIYAPEWRGWEDFLGVPPQFEDGRTSLRHLALNTMEEYRGFVKCQRGKEDELVSRLPDRPELYYKTLWRGWDHWLSVD